MGVRTIVSTHQRLVVGGDDFAHYRVYFAASFSATFSFPKASMKMEFRVRPF